MIKVSAGQSNYTNDDWRHRAACRDEDPELFFPVGTSGAAYDKQVAEAKAVCWGCPVRSQCLSWALAIGQDTGVWGGLDEHERRALKRKQDARRAAAAGASGGSTRRGSGRRAA